MRLLKACNIWLLQMKAGRSRGVSAEVCLGTGNSSYRLSIGSVVGIPVFVAANKLKNKSEWCKMEVQK